jgi:carbamoyl-phosphate synthase large subunit
MKINNQPLIAVSGLGRGESPQPGPAVITSLRRRWPHLHIAGLVYDALESGVYSEDGPEAAFTLPYPSCGSKILLHRLDEIRKQFPFTVLIPTLDVEMEPLLLLTQELAARGLQVMLPEVMAFKARNKQHLSQVAEQAGVLTPRTFAVYDPAEAAEWTQHLGGTAMIKGPFYEAVRADSPAQARAHATRILAEWGGPVLVQERLEGDEYDLLAVGNGHGETLGCCAIRKLVVSSRGKGYAGITVSDDDLNRAGANLMRALQWRGPWECEFIRHRDGQFYLIEINPRFPAWADFPAAIGTNLVAAALEQTLGHTPSPLAEVPPGKVFLRHSVDIVCDASEFSQLTMDGQLLRQPIT